MKKKNFNKKMAGIAKFSIKYSKSLSKNNKTKLRNTQVK
jgi:hypothetical protein